MDTPLSDLLLRHIEGCERCRGVAGHTFLVAAMAGPDGVGTEVLRAAGPAFPWPCSDGEAVAHRAYAEIETLLKHPAWTWCPQGVPAAPPDTLPPRNGAATV